MVDAKTLEQMLRETAAEGEARRSFAGRERLVILLLTDAADRIGSDRQAPEHPNYREQHQRTGDATV